MFTPRTTILLCLLLTFYAAGSYLDAAEESDKPEIETANNVCISWPDEDIVVPLQDLDYLEYLAMAPQARGKSRDRSGRRARHEERIGLFRLWRIMEELELNDDQVDKFFPLMRKMIGRERELAGKKRELLKSLRKELKKEEPSDKKLDRLMIEIRNQAKLAWQERVNNLDQFAGLLTVEQRARLFLSLNNVEKDIWESIARVRMGPVIKPEFKFDKEKFQRQMQKLRIDMDSLNIRLKLEGLPGLPEFMGTIDEDEEPEEEKPEN